MTKKFNLTEKIKPHCRQIFSIYHHDKPMLLVEDVSEFIRLLKDEIDGDINFNLLYLNNKDFKGNERDIVQSVQNKLILLKKKIDNLSGTAFSNHSPQLNVSGARKRETVSKEEDLK